VLVFRRYEGRRPLPDRCARSSLCTLWSSCASLTPCPSFFPSPEVFRGLPPLESSLLLFSLSASAGQFFFPLLPRSIETSPPFFPVHFFVICVFPLLQGVAVGQMPVLSPIFDVDILHSRPLLFFLSLRIHPRLLFLLPRRNPARSRNAPPSALSVLEFRSSLRSHGPISYRGFRAAAGSRHSGSPLPSLSTDGHAHS